MNAVENGFKVVNVDDSMLNKLRRNNNTLDCGAEKVLESLDLFCDDLKDKYSYEGKIPYENMFNALRSVIKGAYENENVRNAIITGIIQETSPVKTKVEEPKPQKQEVATERVSLDKEEVRVFAKDHTLSECAEHFGCTRRQMMNFVSWHKIDFIRVQNGRKSSLNELSVRSIAPQMTLKELAALFKVTPHCMGMYLKRHGIKHKV